MPEKFDIFRTTQFYFEDKYYLGGGEVKAYINPPANFFEHYYTLHYLTQKLEYSFEYKICKLYDFAYTGKKFEYFKKNFKKFFPDAFMSLEIPNKLDNLTNFNSLYYKNKMEIRTGIYAISLAAALGYKRIYLIGFDGYKKDAINYAFTMANKNLDKILKLKIKELGEGFGKGIIHSNEMDIQALGFIQKNYKVEMLSLCPNSPLNQYINLAPQNFIYDKSFIKEKPKDSIKDILIPPDIAYKQYRKMYLRPILEENIYFRLIKDLIKLPSAVKNYLKIKL